MLTTWLVVAAAAALLASASSPNATVSERKERPSGLQVLQQGLKGMQKLVQPFSVRGVSDTMATLTGLLAAVGGGYLTYVTMVALFGNQQLPPHAYPAPPHLYAPPQRRSELRHVLRSVATFDYPEASFRLLRIEGDACKRRAVCEFERFLARKGVASLVLKAVSKKITGMEKYMDAAYRGLSNGDCNFSCPHTLGQSLLRSIGLN